MNHSRHRVEGRAGSGSPLISPGAGAGRLGLGLRLADMGPGCPLGHGDGPSALAADEEIFAAEDHSSQLDAVGSDQCVLVVKAERRQEVPQAGPALWIQGDPAPPLYEVHVDVLRLVHDNTRLLSAKTG